MALDPEQERIKNELHLEGIIYTYKSGESIPYGQKGFDEMKLQLVERVNRMRFLSPRELKIKLVFYGRI